MGRKWRGREAFEAAAPEREARAEEIRVALPQIAFVIGIFDPEWRPDMAKLVRPSRDKGQLPPVGWTEAAFEVLRAADCYLLIAEIVEEIADRYDLDIRSVNDSLRGHTAVTKTLMSTYKDKLVSDGGSPARWALRSRGLAVPGDQ